MSLDPGEHAWQVWWAWRPVRTTRSCKWVWLAPIYRRACYHTYSTIHESQQYEYGGIVDVLVSEPNASYYRR